MDLNKELLKLREEAKNKLATCKTGSRKENLVVYKFEQQRKGTMRKWFSKK